jgi:hypothetical protein
MLVRFACLEPGRCQEAGGWLPATHQTLSGVLNGCEWLMQEHLATLATLALGDTADKEVADVERKIQLKALELHAFAHHSTPMPRLLKYLDSGGCSSVWLAGGDSRLMLRVPALQCVMRCLMDAVHPG